MERKRQKESYVFEKEIENIMAWKSQLDTLLDTENIDTRAIFPLVSRYTGALPPNTPSHNILQNDYLTNSATKTKSLTSNFVISSR